MKCIYIDPPYNTGNEGRACIDNMNSHLIQDWLGKVVDRDDLAKHGKWLCMVMPRPKLLLGDGTIFVSIDDHEVYHLRCLTDEVFNEENFFASIIWHHRKSKQNGIGVSLGRNCIFGYTKDDNQSELRAMPIDESHFSSPDNDLRGCQTLDPVDAPSVRPDFTYEIVKRTTGRGYCPPQGRHWRFHQEKYEQALKDGHIVLGSAGREKPHYKPFIDETREKERSIAMVWQDVGTTTNATEELSHIFGRKGVFATSKPSDLIRKIIFFSTDPDSIILDSFAGSGTTDHAVLAQNQEDGANRRFIFVECEDYADSTTAEHIRRVIKGVPGSTDETIKSDLGCTYSYIELVCAMQHESLLDGSSLPSWEKLASHLFFTATGQELDPSVIIRDPGCIGQMVSHCVFLLYEPDVGKLINLALSLSEARTLPSGSKRKLVFAPAKHLGRELLHKCGIDYQQLSFQINERLNSYRSE